MKRKRIIALVLSLVVSASASTSISAFAAEGNNVNAENNITTESNIINYDSLNEKIADKAYEITDNENYHCTSLQYAIMDGDNIITSDNSGVYSKTENRILMPDNMYGVGSVSKMYTTAAVMKLVDEGKIDLDMPLTTYIPDFKMADERYTKITPRMLLNHSSGLMGTTGSNVGLCNDNDTRTHDNLLNILSEERLKADPGEFSVYCNDGFFLAEILVERVSGETFSEYINENISKPLGLTHTKTPVDKFDKSDLAKTYIFSEDEADPAESFMTIGAGGIYSTAEEVCKFARGITRKDGKAILSDKSIDAMAEKEYLKGVWPTDVKDNVIGYGLGWDSVDMYPLNKYGIKALCKGGDTLEYHSCVITLPEYNLTMAVASSGSSSTVDEAFAIEALLQVLKAKKIIPEILPDETYKEERSQSMPKELMEYSGLYNLGKYLGSVEIKENGDLVYTDPTVKEPLTYHHTYSGYFINDKNDDAIKFVKEKNGEIYLEEKQLISLPGLPQLAICQYAGQKVEKNELTAEENEAWKKRSEKVYCVLDEKYSSMQYMMTGFLNLLPDENGYVVGNKIVNENDGISNVKIPVMSGRDLQDYKFFTKDGIEYGKLGTTMCMSIDGVGVLGDNDKDITIGDDGYTKWYKIPDEMAGKTLKVKSSDKSAVVLYDEGGKCLNDSYVSNKKSMTLEKNSIIGFVGEKGEKFNWEVSDK